MNGLLALNPLARVPGRAVDFGQRPDGRQQDEDAAEDAQLGERISAVMKNLGHPQRTFRRREL